MVDNPHFRMSVYSNEDHVYKIYKVIFWEDFWDPKQATKPPISVEKGHQTASQSNGWTVLDEDRGLDAFEGVLRLRTWRSTPLRAVGAVGTRFLRGRKDDGKMKKVERAIVAGSLSPSFHEMDRWNIHHVCKVSAFSTPSWMVNSVRSTSVEPSPQNGCCMMLLHWWSLSAPLQAGIESKQHIQ